MVAVRRDEQTQHKYCQQYCARKHKSYTLVPKRKGMRVGGSPAAEASTTDGKVSAKPSRKRIDDVCSYRPSPCTRQRCGYASRPSILPLASSVLFCNLGSPISSDWPSVVTPRRTRPRLEISTCGIPQRDAGTSSTSGDSDAPGALSTDLSPSLLCLFENAKRRRVSHGAILCPHGHCTRPCGTRRRAGASAAPMLCDDCTCPC